MDTVTDERHGLHRRGHPGHGIELQTGTYQHEHVGKLSLYIALIKRALRLRVSIHSQVRTASVLRNLRYQ